MFLQTPFKNFLIVQAELNTLPNSTNYASLLETEGELGNGWLSELIAYRREMEPTKKNRQLAMFGKKAYVATVCWEAVTCYWELRDVRNAFAY